MIISETVHRITIDDEIELTLTDDQVNRLIECLNEIRGRRPASYRVKIED